ncbi:MAG: amidohydrolase family protein [Vicinamibacterales bacterium]
MDQQLGMLIKGGVVVTPAGLCRSDLEVRGETVAAIEPDIDPRPGQRVLDARGKYVLPGVVDVHTHPVYADDLGGISVAAACGGVTTMIHYAYARPGMGLLETLRGFREEALQKSLLDFGLHAGLFDVERQIAEVPAAFREGVTSFKVFMTYAKLRWMTDDYWLTALLDVVGGEKGLVAVHAENGLATDYLEDKFLREGASPVLAFTRMRPALLEAEAVNRAIALAAVMRCALYVPHVSAAACLEPLRLARAEGLPVHGETCPQYLTLTDAVTQSKGPLAKIGPPLRTAADTEHLWQALADGTLSTIASDHAPKPKRIDDDFFQAPYGSPQIETMLAVTYNHGVNGGLLPLPRLVRALSEMPARLFGLYPRKGALQAGSDADLVIFDPTRPARLSASTGHSAAGYCLYEGLEVTGAPVMTMQRGRVVVDGEEVLASPGSARFLPTDTSGWYREEARARPS